MDLLGISSIADLIKTGLNKFVADPGQREAATLALAQLEQNGHFKEMDNDLAAMKAQTDTNAVEAASTSILVSGGRPFVIWVCGFAFAYATIIEPLSRFVASVNFGYTGAFPVIDTTITMQALFGLLGLGAMRSFDKKNGVAS